MNNFDQHAVRGVNAASQEESIEAHETLLISILTVMARNAENPLDLLRDVEEEVSKRLPHENQSAALSVCESLTGRARSNISSL